MAGLLDIAPATTIVVVGETEVVVAGLSVRSVASLLARYPELRAMLAQQAGAITVDSLVSMIPHAIAGIIAAGCGMPGDADAEAKAEAVPLEAQADLLDAILRLTMPRGVGPFVARLRGLGEQLGVVGRAPAIPGMTSQSPSNT